MSDLTDKELRWLEVAAIEGGGLYAGWHWDAAPKVFVKLERLGLVRLSHPENRSHKPRAVATHEGRQVLKQGKAA